MSEAIEAKAKDAGMSLTNAVLENPQRVRLIIVVGRRRARAITIRMNPLLLPPRRDDFVEKLWVGAEDGEGRDEPAVADGPLNDIALEKPVDWGEELWVWGELLAFMMKLKSR